MNKKKKNKTLAGLFALIIIFVSILIGLFIKNMIDNGNSKEVNKPVALDKIKDYDYVLEDRDTESFKKKFDELKTILSKSEIDYEAYAKILSELYIIDLYTLKNKSSVYDVGSVEFVYPEAADNFAIKVKDTIYKYMVDNSDKKRKQELPEVKSTTIKDITSDKFVVKDKELEGYIVKINWNYVKDLGYDTEATIKVGKVDKKLYVVEQSKE